MADALHDSNYLASLLVSNTGFTTPVRITGAVLTNSNPLHVALVDATGSQVSSFGGSSASVGATASTVPASADYVGANKAGNLTGLLMGSQTTANSLAVALASDQVSIPVSASIAAAQTLATVTTVSTLTNQTQEGGVNISLNAGTVDTGTRRVVQANGAGKTIVSKSGSAASSGNNTLVAAGTNKLKVFAFSLSTSSTTALTVKFQDGASGTDLWSVILQAPTSISTGANLAVSPPAWLFNTSAATLLNLNISSANAVQWSVSYFDEA